MEKLSLGGEGIRETTKIICQVSVIGKELDVSSINLDSSFLSKLDIFFASKWREAPVFADDDLLTTWKLIL